MSKKRNEDHHTNEATKRSKLTHFFTRIDQQNKVCQNDTTFNNSVSGKYDTDIT